ncbi:MAG: tetratricopeptide repeat protein [Phycisphaerae bacterium]|jgi:4-amino-4-deoxy-L-arabinose transferase-like glycosyltransferase
MSGTAERPTRPPTVDRWNGRDVLLFALIVLVALGLRVIYDLQLRHSPLFADPSMDELYHDQWGQAIAAGRSFVDGPYFRAPLYPAMLGLVYSVFGHSYLAPRMVQAVLGAISCGLVFVIGRRLFGRAVAAVAGFAAASYWILIYFDGELLIPPLIVPLDLLLIWLLLRAERSSGVVIFAVCGVVLGLSAIARPNVLLFGPAIVLWLLIRFRRQWRRALLHAACVTAGCLLVVLPITIRNWVVGKDLVLIASQGGVNFYIGNNPQTDGATAIVPGTPAGWWEGYRAAIARAEAARGGKLKASEVSDYYYDEAWAFIRNEPGRWLSLMVRKLRLFWGAWEISNNKGIYFWSEQFTPVLTWLPLNFALVGPAGILGLVLCWRRRGELFPLWGFVLVYMVSVVLFFCTARYRVPLLPLLILLGTYAGFSVVKAVRSQRWLAVAGQGVVLVLAATLVLTTPGGERARDDAQDYVQLGRRYQRLGESDRAAECYAKAVKLAPDFVTARSKYGTLLAQTGHLPEAIEQLQQALATGQLRPGETKQTLARVHTNLATALTDSGSPAEGVEHYRQALELDPAGAEDYVQFKLGLALVKLDRLEEAVSAFEKALAISPYPLLVLDQLSAALARLGEYERAAELARRAIDLAESSREPAEPDLLDSLRERLERYESGQP